MLHCRMTAHQRVQAVNKWSENVETFSCVANEENKLELDLRQADLWEVPESFLKLEGLKVLKLCTDRLHSLHRSMSELDEPKELFLHTTEYERIHTDTILQSGVGLYEVPCCISQLKRLQVLSVYGNPGVPLLLDEVISWQLTTLIELEMVNCGISKLPEPTGVGGWGHKVTTAEIEFVKKQFEVVEIVVQC